ncbi:hypothetical protein CEQ20_18525 [Yersinia pseudotuberculosis]|nr:hypothetical protein CEQ20_18525 [Yersinia pseudotuberculosis]AYX10833.1 hypothetical protein EGX52_08575 [Yersinia pseudotuberculosis]MBO1567376.1 transposase [Yersinia pseudotuberculosis]MBO1590841.1 transposase [Yersinia pseudotuberculosis]MBO1604235.1 transposase [Yersinia pseudotuberculosis]
MSRQFTAEFKLEAAKLVIDQKYIVIEATKAMNVSLSAMTRWVSKLRLERQGKAPFLSPKIPFTICTS